MTQYPFVILKRKDEIILFIFLRKDYLRRKNSCNKKLVYLVMNITKKIICHYSLHINNWIYFLCKPYLHLNKISCNIKIKTCLFFQEYISNKYEDHIVSLLSLHYSSIINRIVVLHYSNNKSRDWFQRFWSYKPRETVSDFLMLLLISNWYIVYFIISVNFRMHISQLIKESEQPYAGYVYIYNNSDFIYLFFYQE